MTDRDIIATLRPCIDQASAANLGASPAALANAALALIDPEATGPSLVREGCRTTLEQIARDTLAERPAP